MEYQRGKYYISNRRFKDEIYRKLINISDFPSSRWKFPRQSFKTFQKNQATNSYSEPIKKRLEQTYSWLQINHNCRIFNTRFYSQEQKLLQMVIHVKKSHFNYPADHNISIQKQSLGISWAQGYNVACHSDAGLRSLGCAWPFRNCSVNQMNKQFKTWSYDDSVSLGPSGNFFSGPWRGSGQPAEFKQ